MIKFISHRANLNGPSLTENSINSIFYCLKNTIFDVEIDIFYKNNIINIGHEYPCTEKLSIKDFLNIFTQYKDRLWLHCKDINSMQLFSELECDFNYFGHSNDDFVLTSNKYIFTKPGIFDKNAILVMPELIDEKIDSMCFNTKGILTDYPIKYETYYNSIRA